MENKKLGNRGFGGYELLTMAMVCLVLSVIMIEITLGARDNERYKVFAYNSKMFGINASGLQMLEEQKIIYLSELIENGYMAPIKNPFDEDSYCNQYESKVVFDGNKKKIFLTCGDYVIQNQSLDGSKVSIYKVSDWEEEKKDQKNVSKTFYNYLQNQKYVFPFFLEDEIFLKKMNYMRQNQYQNIDEMKNDIKIEEKTFYRTEKEVKKVKY